MRNTMRILIAMAAAASLAIQPVLASPGGGGTASNGMGISGSAANTCTLGAPTLGSTSDATLSSATPSSGVVTISNFVDPSNAAYVDGISITLNFDAMCNYASKFQSETQSGAMLNSVPVVAGSGAFVSALNYSALLQWAGQTSVLNTDGTANKKGTLKSVNGANKGTASLSITLTAPANRPLLAGSFTDQFTIQIGAAL